jgi:transposase
LKEKDKRIAELEILLKAALEEIERLKARIAQLEKHSGNSSKPPSSDIVKPPKTRENNSKRKIGAQKGHKQHLRTPFEENQVDKKVDIKLEACPKCGGALQDTLEAPKKYQQVELVEKPFVVTEYRTYRYWCEHCQCEHESKLPLEVRSTGLFGQNLITLTGYLKSRCHMSYKTIQSFYSDAMSLKVSTGFLAKQVDKVSEALKAPYDKLVSQLPKAEHLYVDETGSKENGKRTWCFRGNDFTVFHIAHSRSSKVLLELLGKDYAGVITCDFYSAYKKFKRLSKASLQLCWSHLIREVRFFEGLPDNMVSGWGKSLLKQISAMFKTHHSREELEANDWYREMNLCKALILDVALRQVPSDKGVQTLSARLQKWQDEYFRFIEEGLEPTNNLCEQSLEFCGYRSPDNARDSRRLGQSL